MLCKACHTRVRRDFPYCLSCGTLRKRAKVHTHTAPVLRWADLSVSLVDRETLVGRGEDAGVRIDDPSVSRSHARIVREADGFVVEDLGSSNGTWIRSPGGEMRPVRGERVTLHDGAVIGFGDVDVTFLQPRSTKIGSKTMVRGTEHTRLAVAKSELPQAPEATEPLNARPEQRSGWALKQVPSPSGVHTWVLRNTRTGRYLSLDERELFIWNQLDGNRTIREILFAYLEEFGELALPRIEAALRTFADAGLVRGLPDLEPELTGWQRFKRWLISNLLRVQVAIKGLDPLVERSYRRVFWLFFTRPAVLALWVLIIAGIYSFATADAELFDLAGAGPIGAVIIMAGYLVATAMHEAAHAFAVKSYGRRVNRGGFMVMLGFPFAFVDTSDMWFGTPWSRIVVALSGPMTTAGIAGGASIYAAHGGSPEAAGVCYALAFGLYINTLFNLIPLMPLDGYQAMADALRTPRLREEAKEYFFHGFWSDLRHGRRPGAKQVGLVIFAVTSAVCLYAMLALAVVLWNSRLGDHLQDHVEQPFLTIVIVAVLALLLFPIWYPPARKLSARRRKRRAAAQTTEPAAVPAA